MAKYTFSQGKITVENGVYQPVLKGKDTSQASVVLVFLPLSTQKSESSLSSKEMKPATSSK